VFDISYYYAVSIARPVDLLFGKPPTDKTRLLILNEADMSVEEIKVKYYPVVFKHLIDMGIPTDCDYMFLWYEDRKWNMFDINLLPEISSWDDLREATGKYDI